MRRFKRLRWNFSKGISLVLPPPWIGAKKSFDWLPTGSFGTDGFTYRPLVAMRRNMSRPLRTNYRAALQERQNNGRETLKSFEMSCCWDADFFCTTCDQTSKQREINPAAAAHNPDTSLNTASPGCLQPAHATHAGNKNNNNKKKIIQFLRKPLWSGITWLAFIRVWRSASCRL